MRCINELFPIPAPFNRYIQFRRGVLNGERDIFEIGDIITPVTISEVYSMSGEMTAIQGLAFASALQLLLALYVAKTLRHKKVRLFRRTHNHFDKIGVNPLKVRE